MDNEEKMEEESDGSDCDSPLARHRSDWNKDLMNEWSFTARRHQRSHWAQRILNKSTTTTNGYN